MLKQHYKWKQPIRALGISGFFVGTSGTKEQVSFSPIRKELIKEEKLEEKIANLKEKYGKQIITYGALLSKDFDLYKEDINNQIPYRPFQKINRVIFIFLLTCSEKSIIIQDININVKIRKIISRSTQGLLAKNRNFLTYFHKFLLT